ncbi:MAG: PorT family protein [Flavobacteriales bacterium]|jgi:hypothetical protein|nr:PorT family protein [Flavobacteriales bacterium]
MKKGVLLLLVSFCAMYTLAQQVQMMNLRDFDKRAFHFGFALGYNSSDFYLDRDVLEDFERDSLLVLDVERRPGFNLGIVSSLDVSPTFKIRFLPTLSFQERNLAYTYAYQGDSSVQWNKKVESTFLDFPLVMKFRTERIKNFAAYCLAGGRFGLDMASNKDVKNSNASLKDQIVKITKPDYGFEVGGGIDLFLEYFKFGIELKLSTGLKNVLIQENTQFSTPIDRLRTKMWTLSFTFEG